jgi:hypothetical protein
LGVVMEGLPLHKVSAEEFGQVVLEEIQNAAERTFEDIDSTRLSAEQDTVEVDVAIPFRIRVATTPETGRMKDDPICCICVSQDGHVTCLGGCCP